VHIVEDNDEFKSLSHAIARESTYISYVCADADKHVSNNNISLLFFYFFVSDLYYCLPIRHNEAVCLPNALADIKKALKDSNYHKKIVSDKKSIVQLFGEDCNFIDIDVYNFLENGIVPDEKPTTSAHRFVHSNFKNLPNLNSCVPLYKHAKMFLDQVEKIKNIQVNNTKEKGFVFTNTTMTSLFAKLESNGLCVSDDFTDAFGEEQTKHIKKNLVFSQYNLLTSTGRPSNRFGGVNYAALNKNDGSRNCFVSRYGKDGMLVMMDYNAFHPRLIAHLSNFNMEAGENPYAYLAKHYFNKQNVTDEDISVAKGFTFTQIYGGIDKKWIHIPYFKKVQEYIDHRWKFFEQNGYIETPKYGRKIKHCHIQDPTPNKLFNYILQAFETEMAVDVLGDLLDDLKGKKTLPILYTYDSILFDAHKDDKMDTIKRLKTIMERDKFPVKVYAGNNYGDMKQVAL
jgi:HKD family nuclease